MPRITKIEQQQKNKSRFSVYVDEKYSFSLSNWQLADRQLKVDQEIKQNELDELVQSVEFGKLYDRTLNWLAIRDRSGDEVKQYLWRKTKDEDLREKVYAKVEEAGYINDRKFAEQWVRYRREVKHKSDNELRMELKQKRVDDSVISELLGDEESELDALRVMVEKKSRLSQYKDQNKLIAYLARKGFRYADIKSVLSEAED